MPTGLHLGLAFVVALGCGLASGTGCGAAAAQPAAERSAPREIDPAPSATSDVLEVLQGRASYYADSLAGNSTASGEPYDPRALTAASRDLPFGSLVRVTRVGTDFSVIVRVNDRGPFRDHSRILDLSRAAAEQLDMMRAGVIEIRAEVLRLGPES